MTTAKYMKPVIELMQLENSEMLCLSVGIDPTKSANMEDADARRKAWDASNWTETFSDEEEE